LGTQCKEWCTSTVCGKELPPRYAVTTLDRARDELILAAGRCRRTKWYILIRWLVGGDIHDEDFMLPDDVATPEEVVDVLDAYFEGLQVDTHRDALLRTAGKFGLPGAVLYLEPTGKEVHMARYCCCSAVCCCGSCCSETVRTYRPVWVDAQAMADEGLLLSGRVLSDHMPDYCSKVLARLAKEMGE